MIVLGEIRDGELRNVTFEAIAAGRTISGDGEVIGVLIGENVQSIAQELIHYGADKVLTAEDPKLRTYTADGYSQVMRGVIEQENPDSVIFGHTAMGKDLSPKLAARLQTGLISDAIDVSVTGGNVVFTRPIYSGKAFERVISTDPMIFATIRPNNIQASEKDTSRSGSIESIDVSLTDLRTVIQEVVKKQLTALISPKQKLSLRAAEESKAWKDFSRCRSLQRC